MSIDLAIRNVSHSFALQGGPLPVLDDISLDIAAGSFVSLLGPSGCGKSTLLRLIAGLELPTAGEIIAGGEAVRGPGPSRILAFQDATLFPWANVWNNVATGLAARHELKGREKVIDDALDLVRLTGFAKAYPHQLSGGMTQRAALARALVNAPQILLLDEPFGKLDALTRMSLQDELLAIWKRTGFTGLLVTHDVEEALLLSGRIVVLSDRPARPLALIGGTLLLVAAGWWASIFLRVIGNGYLSVIEAARCSAVSSVICDLATSLCGKTHPLGITWYSPLLLWLAVALLSASALAARDET